MECVIDLNYNFFTFVTIERTRWRCSLAHVEGVDQIHFFINIANNAAGIFWGFQFANIIRVVYVKRSPIAPHQAPDIAPIHRALVVHICQINLTSIVRYTNQSTSMFSCENSSLMTCMYNEYSCGKKTTDKSASTFWSTRQTPLVVYIHHFQGSAFVRIRIPEEITDKSTNLRSVDLVTLVNHRFNNAFAGNIFH